MAEIIYWAGFTDKGLTLSNEEFVRSLSVGSNWSRIRIGIHFGFRTAFLNFSCVSVLGLCSGKTNPFNAGSTTNFLGMNWGSEQSATANWTYFYGPPLYDISQGMTVLKRVGSTTTIGPYYSGDEYWLCNTDQNYRACAFMDITKGSPNWTVSAYNIVTNTTTATFLGALTTDTVPPPGATTRINAQTFAFDEVAGGLDTLDIYHNSTVQPLDIWYVGAARFAV